MSAAWRSLRLRLAVTGFAAIYLPVLLLFGVTTVTEERVTEVRGGAELSAETSDGASAWVVLTVVGLAPAAAALAWLWAGRAMRPIERAVGAQQRLVEETSHDLRTPLSVLVTNADVLLADPAPSIASYREGLERSRAAALRLQTTIDELLVDARGRARTLDRAPADLSRLVREVANDARVLAGESDVALTVAAPGEVVCRLDEPAVRRAVANLLDNAVAHAPAGSSVEVTVEADGDDASVVVADHGDGVPPDRQARIFERFWRGDAEVGRAGLGLPIAKQIAVAHGGDLSVRSPGPAGDGASFRLTLRR